MENRLHNKQEINNAIGILFFEMIHLEFQTLVNRVSGTFNVTRSDMVGALQSTASLFKKNLEIINPVLDLELDYLISDFIDRWQKLPDDER